MPILHPHFATLIWLGYVALAAWAWYNHRNPANSGRPYRHTPAHWLLGGLLLIHAPLAFFPLASTLPHFGAREALALLTWVAVLIFWVAAWPIRLDGLQTILLPVAAFSLGIGLLVPAGHATPWLISPLMQAHFAIAMLAYGFLAVAAGLAVLMRLADHELHHPSRGLLHQLPPLLALERLLFSTLSLGFTLLTATLATGAIFAEELFGHSLILNHKIVFSLAAWTVFGALLWGRQTRGWRGRIAVNWTLAGFTLLLLAYIGSRFVLDAVLHR
ncbi:cytochrome C biogenesis protein [Chitinimonas arctica]|uniref:Cytochrome C biogenesis protein n=1 Tax=Chitinimonas arctica TaxID=2594795 RepID=A0A516SEA3_9NEIS|nr:cytochrome c biogenesis protein CcsA [Chitinimonas arctica]QDQ26348.1 cytochrome C biogenesis protein [Chitinimonas arctica]